MIDSTLFFQWMIAATVIVITPGPDSLLIMRNAANSGLKVGLSTVLGVQLGVIFHTLLALFGASKFMAGQPLLILLIGIGGPLFIAYLAWQTWTAGMLGGRLRDGRQTTALKACRDAFMTNALNPKVILAFFAILLPQISPALPRGPQVLLMGLFLLSVNIVWQLGLAFGAERFFRILTNPSVQTRINRSVALILLILAILLPFQAYNKVQELSQPSSQPSSEITPGSEAN